MYLDRVEAIEGLQQNEKMDESTKAVLVKALQDTHFSIRGAALNLLDINDPIAEPLIEKAAYSDAHSEVRAAAIFKIGQTGDKKYAATLKKVLDNERAFSVISEALQSLYAIDRDEALKYIPKLENEESQNIVMALGLIYAENPVPERAAFFEKKLNMVNGMDAIQFFNSYATMCTGMDEGIQEKCIKNLQAIGMSSSDTPWRKYGATKALADMKIIYKALNNIGKTQEISKIIDEIKVKESSGQLKSIYDQF
jgi:aminopeptidase N